MHRINSTEHTNLVEGDNPISKYSGKIGKEQNYMQIDILSNRTIAKVLAFGIVPIGISILIVRIYRSNRS